MWKASEKKNYTVLLAKSERNKSLERSKFRKRIILKESEVNRTV